MTLAAGLEPTLDLSGYGTGAVYLLVFGFVFIESGILLGFFLPGDSLLFGAGLLAAAPGAEVSVVVLALGVAVAAVAGDALGYLTGTRLGRPWLQKRPAMAVHVARAEAFYARWGAWAVVFARWFPWLRTAVPVLAGIAHMPCRRFLAANVVGALTWGVGLVALGYYAYEIDWLRTAAILVAAVSIALFVLIGTGRWLVTRRRRTSDRREAASAGPSTG